MENRSMIKSIGGGVWKLIQTHIVMMIFGVMVYLPVGGAIDYIIAFILPFFNINNIFFAESLHFSFSVI